MKQFCAVRHCDSIEMTPVVPEFQKGSPPVLCCWRKNDGPTRNPMPINWASWYTPCAEGTLNHYPCNWTCCKRAKTWGLRCCQLAHRSGSSVQVSIACELLFSAMSWGCLNSMLRSPELEMICDDPVNLINLRLLSGIWGNYLRYHFMFIARMILLHVQHRQRCKT